MLIVAIIHENNNKEVRVETWSVIIEDAYFV